MSKEDGLGERQTSSSKLHPRHATRLVKPTKPQVEDSAPTQKAENNEFEMIVSTSANAQHEGSRSDQHRHSRQLEREMRNESGAESMSRRIRELEYENQKQKKELSQTKSQLHDADQKVEALRKREAELLQRLGNQDSASSEMTQKLQNKIVEQEAAIEALQNDIYKVKATIGKPTEPDSVLKLDFNTLEDLVKTFCKTHALQDYPTSGYSALLKDRDGVSKAILSDEGKNALRHLPQSRPLPMLLSAVLTQYVFRHIFLSPNCFLDPLEQHLFGQESLVVHKGIEGLFKFLEQYYGVEYESVQMVRSEIQKLISPLPESANGQMAPVLLEHVNEAKKLMCDHYANHFISSAEKVLSSDDEDSLLGDLSQLMQHALDVSLRLKMQRGRVLVNWLPEMPNEFVSDVYPLQAHGSHAFDLEDNEKALDGPAILLVTHPAVIVVGSSDGSDASVIRVLKKATVWMGEA